MALAEVGRTLGEEVEHLAGQRHARKDEGESYYRHGSNPGTARCGGQCHPVGFGASVTRQGRRSVDHDNPALREGALREHAGGRAFRSWASRHVLYSAESGECVVVDPAAEAHVLLQRIHELDDN